MLLILRYHTILINFITKEAHFDHWNKEESAKLFHCKVSFPFCNRFCDWYFETMFLSHSLSAFNLFIFLYPNGFMISYSVQWVIILHYHYYLFVCLYCPWLGHAETTISMDVSSPSLGSDTSCQAAHLNLPDAPQPTRAQAPCTRPPHLPQAAGMPTLLCSTKWL